MARKSAGLMPGFLGLSGWEACFGLKGNAETISNCFSLLANWCKRKMYSTDDIINEALYLCEQCI